MNTLPSMLDSIKTIQSVQRRITLGIGITMGVLLISYFFTFAMFLDRGMTGLLRFEMITSIIFFISFFFLNKISFGITKLIYARRKPYQDIFNYLNSNDSGKEPEEINTRIKGHLN